MTMKSQFLIYIVSFIWLQYCLFYIYVCHIYKSYILSVFIDWENVYKVFFFCETVPISLPRNWDPIPAGNPFLAVNISRVSKEAEEVEKNISLTARKTINEILTVCRTNYTSAVIVNENIFADKKWSKSCNWKWQFECYTCSMQIDKTRVFTHIRPFAILDSLSPSHLHDGNLQLLRVTSEIHSCLPMTYDLCNVM